jgi:hypothetical protein
MTRPLATQETTIIEPPSAPLMADDSRIASISEYTATMDFEESLPWLALIPHRRIERRRLPLLASPPPRPS